MQLQLDHINEWHTNVVDIGIDPMHALKSAHVLNWLFLRQCCLKQEPFPHNLLVKCQQKVELWLPPIIISAHYPKPYSVVTQ